jgi:hypothetical protein
MILGMLLIAVAVNFLVVGRGPTTNPYFVIDLLGAAFCGGAVIVVGLILVLSTLGRWRKVRQASR